MKTLVLHSYWCNDYAMEQYYNIPALPINIKENKPLRYRFATLR